jgi:hypothetical protein
VKAIFLRMSATLKAFAIVLSIRTPECDRNRRPLDLLLAAALKACARTSSFFEMSPRARILTGSCRFASPFPSATQGYLGACVEALPRGRQVDGWVLVRKFSNGIDFFMCGPRSFRIRMWIGFWPPS